MVEGAAEDMADAGLKASELKNPLKVAKKLLGNLEKGIGAALNGMAHPELTAILKDERIADGVEALGGMLASGAISQPDLDNLVSGFSIGPFARWGKKIIDAIAGKSKNYAPSASGSINTPQSPTRKYLI